MLDPSADVKMANSSLMPKTLLQMAKSYGLKNPKEVAELTVTPTSTLADWRTTRPKRLKALMLGAKSIKKDQE